MSILEVVPVEEIVDWQLRGSVVVETCLSAAIRRACSAALFVSSSWICFKVRDFLESSFFCGVAQGATRAGEATVAMGGT